jgi:hypothetical protein
MMLVFQMCLCGTGMCTVPVRHHMFGPSIVLEMGLKSTQNGHLRGGVGVFSVHMGQMEHYRT